MFPSSPAIRNIILPATGGHNLYKQKKHDTKTPPNHTIKKTVQLKGKKNNGQTIVTESPIKERVKMISRK